MLLKRILLISFVASVLFSFRLPVQAFEIKEVSEQKAVKVVDVIASPPVDSSGLQLRVEVVNGTVDDFVLNINDDLLSLPTCLNRKHFTEDSVCVDFASTLGKIEEGTVLGRITISSDDLNTVEVIEGNNNAYLSQGNLYFDNAGNEITVEDEQFLPESEINDTEIRDDNSNILYFLVILLVLMAIGVGVYYFLNTKQKKNS